MSKISLAIDELQKLEASQQFESIREKRKDYARKYREKHPHYSKDYYLAQRTGKVYTMKPNSKREWIRETTFDPSKRDNKELIDLERYGKMKAVNIHELQAKHYCDFKSNLNQVIEGVVDIPKTNKKKGKANKTNKMVERKALNAVGHATKSSRVSRKETPLKSEPDLGCFPQLPLLDVDKFKSIQLLLHKIDDIEQVNKD